MNQRAMMSRTGGTTGPAPQQAPRHRKPSWPLREKAPQYSAVTSSCRLQDIQFYAVVCGHHRARKGTCRLLLRSPRANLFANKCMSWWTSILRPLQLWLARTRLAGTGCDKIGSLHGRRCTGSEPENTASTSAATVWTSAPHGQRSGRQDGTLGIRQHCR